MEGGQEQEKETKKKSSREGQEVAKGMEGEREGWDAGKEVGGVKS